MENKLYLARAGSDFGCCYEIYLFKGNVLKKTGIKWGNFNLTGNSVVDELEGKTLKEAEEFLENEVNYWNDKDNKMVTHSSLFGARLDEVDLEYHIKEESEEESVEEIELNENEEVWA